MHLPDPHPTLTQQLFYNLIKQTRKKTQSCLSQSSSFNQIVLASQSSIYSIETEGIFNSNTSQLFSHTHKIIDRSKQGRSDKHTTQEKLNDV